MPLGINLIVNDKSGWVKVKNFPRGSQARQVANRMGIDPDTMIGAEIIAVNGRTLDSSLRGDSVLALKDPERYMMSDQYSTLTFFFVVYLIQHIFHLFADQKQ